MDLKEYVQQMVKDHREFSGTGSLRGKTPSELGKTCRNPA